MQVLISDSDPNSLSIIKQAVQDIGHDPIIKNGDFSWEALQQKNSPKLAILDLPFLSTNGINLSTQVKKVNSNGTMIIFITDKESVPNISPLCSGMNDFITKPFQTIELITRIKITIQKNNLQDRLLKFENKILFHQAENEQLLASIPCILIELDMDYTITRWNNFASKIFKLDKNEAIGRSLPQCQIECDWGIIEEHIKMCYDSKQTYRIDDMRYTKPEGNDGYLGITVNPIINESEEIYGILLFGAEITKRRELENQLIQAQKLESIGQLAAGIAHEINTPMQFVGDNTIFLRDAFEDLRLLQNSYENLLDATRDDNVQKELVKKIEVELEEIEADYLYEEIPKALKQTLAGIERISKIVRAMKDFSYPDNGDKVNIDINKSIASTVTVAGGEWKYVADIITDFDPNLPLVPCVAGEFNQVILNLIINAVHAISDGRDNRNSENGIIKISTHHVDNWAEVRISDSGVGIPEEIRDKIFNPFFTTKEIGKGTGQGLAIAHSVITQKHSGSLIFETEMGKGTTFIIRLPILEVEE